MLDIGSEVDGLVVIVDSSSVSGFIFCEVGSVIMLLLMAGEALVIDDKDSLLFVVDMGCCGEETTNIEVESDDRPVISTLYEVEVVGIISETCL